MRLRCYSVCNRFDLRQWRPRFLRIGCAPEMKNSVPLNLIARAGGPLRLWTYERLGQEEK